MAKKTYYIPTIEVVQLATSPIMDLAVGSGGKHSQMGQAPRPRRDKVF